jgi:hypothetical protein
VAQVLADYLQEQGFQTETIMCNGIAAWFKIEGEHESKDSTFIGSAYVTVRDIGNVTVEPCTTLSFARRVYDIIESAGLGQWVHPPPTSSTSA